jgi:malate/lactate dehydrogenase
MSTSGWSPPNIRLTRLLSSLPGTYDPKKVLGVTKLDVVRAKAFIGQITGADPKEVDIPVVGGHAGTTILPLLSQVGFLRLGLGGADVTPSSHLQNKL